MEGLDSPSPWSDLIDCYRWIRSCSRLLIDLPTGILIDYQSKDITPAIGSANSPTFTGTSTSLLFFVMSSTFTSIFNNEARVKGVRSQRAVRGAGHHRSMLDHAQSRTARRAAVRREVTPFDFNLGRYQVSNSSAILLGLRD